MSNARDTRTGTDTTTGGGDMKERQRSMVLPFAGFYESMHSETLDEVGASAFTDNGGGVNNKLHDQAWPLFGWRKARRGYARRYVEHLARITGLPMVFESLDSPQFYNYETDRVFALIPESVAKRMYSQAFADKERREDLKRVASEWFTSGPGFMSHYSPRPAEWDGLAGWDHNLLGCLFVAWCLSSGHDPVDMEEYFHDDIRGNSCYIEADLFPDTPEVVALLDAGDEWREKRNREIYGAQVARLAPVGGAK